MPSLITPKEELSLFDLTQYFKHRGLVDEERTALLTVLGIIQRQRYILEAMSGNGKTFLTSITLSLFPQDRIYTWGLDTDAAAFEDQERLEHAWIIFITELQKFMGSDSMMKKEILKDLGEDLGTGTRRRRVSGFKAGGTREVEELEITGNKAVISTLAVENREYKGDDVELTRRYPTFSLDVSPEHISRIVSRQMQLEFRPRRLDILEESRIGAIKLRCSKAIEADLTIHNPVAPGLEKYIPIVDVQTPSFVNHFNHFMRATTRFYSWRAYVAPDKSLYSTIADAYELWEIYSEMFWMSVNHIPFLGKRIVKAIEETEGTTGGTLDKWSGTGDKQVTLKAIHRQLVRKNLTLPYRTLAPLVNRMCDQCFLERHDVDRNNHLYSIADEIKPLEQVNWKEVMRMAMDTIAAVDGKEVAHDWRDHQLNDKGNLVVTDPLSGQQKKVL